ncbi:MAG: beta-carotene 15,15'-dioxygenase, Brp/Blh family [Chryseotalea sp.]
MALPEQVCKRFSVDYLFIGLGAANSLLLLAFERLGLLNQRNFVVIDPSFESLQNKTFCFWAEQSEIDTYNLQSLINYQWPKLQFSNHESQNVYPYQYYCVEGNTLYQQAKKVIDYHKPIFYSKTFSEDFIQIEKDRIEVAIENDTFLVNRVFDNRPPVYNQPKKNESHLLQSFYGWRIIMEEKKFDTSTATLMDFDIPQQGNCQFVYVLPFSENEALVEVTKFGKTKIDREEAKLILRDYGKTEKYIIKEEEEGCIPMSSAALSQEKKVNKNWISTGSRANLIKPSTGYAFLKMAEDATHLSRHVESKSFTTYKREKVSARFQFYDRLLLKIIEQQPERGKVIFQSLFKKIQTKEVLTFLKEKSSISDELRIFSVLPIFLFLKTAFKDVWFSLFRISPVVQTLFLTLFCILFNNLQIQQAIWLLIGLGFFTIGIAHGAIDHVTHQNIRNNVDLLKFIVSYVGKGILLGLLWYWQPDFALLAFLIFSAWHFGQADFEAWKLPSSFFSFLWGTFILGFLLMSHYEETITIVEFLPGLISVNSLKNLPTDSLLFIQVFLYGIGIALAVYTRNVYILLSLFNLYLFIYLPLLISFGLFFIFQHSQHGFTFLKNQLNISTKQFILKALPFSLAGSLFIISFIYFADQPNWGLFFILLSCLSMPHVISMDIFYKVSRVK